MTDLPVPDRLVTGCERALVGLFLAAMTVGAVSAVSAGWSPVSDDALIELAVRDVPAHLPLTGVYSRFGWNHPGPALFYLLAVPYRLLGSASTALLVATLAFQAVATLAAWRLARRLDRLTGLLVFAGLLAVLATTPADALRSPWNPYVALVGAGLLVVVAWAVGSLSAAACFTLLPLGTLLVQAHLVTAPMVLTTCAAGILAALLVRRSTTRRSAQTQQDSTTSDTPSTVPWRWVAAGVALTALMWVPPLVQQLTGDQGNLTAIVSHQGDGERVGVSDAIGSVTHMFSALPSGFRPPDVMSTFVPLRYVVPIWLVVPIAGLVIASRRRDAVHLRGLAVAAAAVLGCLVGIAATSGGLFDYLVVSTRSVVAVTLAVGLGATLTVLSASVRRWVLLGTAVCAAGLCLSIGWQQARGDNPIGGYGPTVDALSDAVLDADLPGTVSVDSALDFRAAEIAPAVLLQLERRGTPVTSSDLTADRIGAHRADRAPDQLVLVAPLDQRAQLEAEGWQVLGEYQPLSPAEQRASETLRAERQALGELPSSDERFRQIMGIVEELDGIEAGRAPMLIATRRA